MPHITQQPKPTSTLSNKERPNDGADHQHQHHSCHSARLRRILIPAIFLTLIAIFLLFLEFPSAGISSEGGLLRRAVTNSGTSPFVKNKLYLIIVIVGLFLVLLTAIGLSVCCCRSAFENPICCPCYLCACCGGLACLECISCGLCAEGLADLNV